LARSALESSSKIVVDLVEQAPVQVLHVDDDLPFSKVVKQCLEMKGFKVETASSVEEATETMKKKKFDVIVSDYVMPGKDGLQFLKELRDKGDNTPFIIFTGRGREEVAIKALNLGADRYFNKTGGPETVYGELVYGIRQVVERRRAEEELRANKNYLETILDSISSGVVVIDEKTHEIVDANPKALETIGASRERVIGKVCHSFICPAEKGRCPISDLGQTVDKSELVLLRANGEKIPILKTVTVTTWRGHKYLIESFIDITEHKKAEKVLAKSEESFKTLTEDAPIAICNTDLKGKITYVNKRFEDDMGYSREEIVGKNGFKLGIMSEETLKSFKKRMKERLMGKPSRFLEGQFKRKDGEWIWAEVESRVIKKFGVPVGFQLTARDITERKRAEEERKRFEERLSALNTYSRRLNMAENMAEIYRLTLDAMEKTLGFENAAFMVVDKDILRVVDQHGFPEPHLRLKLPLNGKRGITVQVARTGSPVLVPDIRKERAYVEVMSGILSELDVPIKIGHKVLGVLNVESKRLNAFDEKDQKLLEILASHAATAISNLESQQKFKRLFMNNPEAADYLDPDFRILDVNPRFEEIFGYSLDEIKGKHINDVIVPKDKMKEGEMLDKKAEEGIVSYDTVRKRKDGSLVPVSISAAPIIVEDQLIGTVGVYKDISQLKRTEKELRETLEKLEMMNEKLRVVGTLTRHDVRNKLFTVIGNAYLIKQRLTCDQEALEYLKDVESACQQVERIFDFATTYERLGVEELAYMDVENNIREAVSLFSDLQDVKIVNDCCGLTVLADSLLRQLFYNLIDNSLKYGEKVRRIRVYYKEIGTDQLKLIYEDDGVGIPKAEKEKIFREGYGKGTGYGLYLIRKMCGVYGWAIKETGEQGRGAQFTITIPKMSENGKVNYKLH